MPMNRNDYLLLSTQGEKYGKEKLTFLTAKDNFTGELIWEKSTIEYSWNPFGKLIKKPARILPNGSILEHKKHYHGWFGMLNCTDEFYEKHKEVLDEFITTDKFFSRKWLPKTL